MAVVSELEPASDAEIPIAGASDNISIVLTGPGIAFGAARILLISKLKSLFGGNSSLIMNRY